MEFHNSRWKIPDCDIYLNFSSQISIELKFNRTSENMYWNSAKWKKKRNAAEISRYRKSLVNEGRPRKYPRTTQHRAAEAGMAWHGRQAVSKFSRRAEPPAAARVWFHRHEIHVYVLGSPKRRLLRKFSVHEALHGGWWKSRCPRGPIKKPGWLSPSPPEYSCQFEGLMEARA